ncbi:hypothetical protein INO76_15545, partial [Staphylococcus aureus]|nr:hypothetical protein [Staphylococcus aureus]
RRPSGKSRSGERTVKDSSIISPTKKDNTSKSKASQESLSRTPSPFKKVEDKAERKPVKDRLGVRDEQHSKSSQPQRSKGQSPSSEKKN